MTTTATVATPIIAQVLNELSRAAHQYATTLRAVQSRIEDETAMVAGGYLTRGIPAQLIVELSTHQTAYNLLIEQAAAAMHGHIDFADAEKLINRAIDEDDSVYFVRDFVRDDD